MSSEKYNDWVDISLAAAREDFKYFMEQTYHRPSDEKYALVFSESVYDWAVVNFGPNCGYDPNKVEVIRGYPKFDEDGI